MRAENFGKIMQMMKSKTSGLLAAALAAGAVQDEAWLQQTRAGEGLVLTI